MAYQVALRQGDSLQQKKRFTSIYEDCEKLLWRIAWSVFRKCRFPRRNNECLVLDENRKWSWRDFSFPLIHGLAIAAARYNPSSQAAFSSFAFSCVRRTLENHCSRRCPRRFEGGEMELTDVPALSAPSPLEIIVRRQEKDALLNAIGRAFSPASREFMMIVLSLCGFIQKDIVFLMNRLYPNPATPLSEPLVSQYLNSRIPDALKQAMGGLDVTFDDRELDHFTLKHLHMDALCDERMPQTFRRAIEQIKGEMHRLVLETRSARESAADNLFHNLCSECPYAKSPESLSCMNKQNSGQEGFDQCFNLLMQDGKKLKSFMKVLKARLTVGYR